ncbi:HK97 family phage prohead protease [Edwardsiella tarda]|uniref:HK97 family phage prohead protease n=1 Tax=Edwardsiella tarda TaxID=636 RepID=UPI000839E311|nr:HK97 family phage prohead protease [Edwardsiella tarda]
MIQNLNLKMESFSVSEEVEGRFSGYANVKWFKDHASDVSVDNCFKKSIDRHIAAGTMPKLLLQHDYRDVIGVWESMEEDEHGLKVTGRLALDTVKGRETYSLLKMGALDSLSIGYVTIEEKYDAGTNTNFLIEVDCREISIVTFACNEASRIDATTIKAAPVDAPAAIIATPVISEAAERKLDELIATLNRS